MEKYTTAGCCAVLDFGPDALLGVFVGLRRGDDLELRLLRAGQGNGVCSLGGWVYDARYSLSCQRQLASCLQEKTSIPWMYSITLP
jgi:hypothetical protein